MDRHYPHEIRRFSDGEPVPDAFIPLSEEEVAMLEPMDPLMRGAWFQVRAMQVEDHVKHEALIQKQQIRGVRRFNDNSGASRPPAEMRKYSPAERDRKRATRRNKRKARRAGRK